MKLLHEVYLTVLAKKEVPYGTEGKTSKRLAVLTPQMEAGMLSVNEDIYKSIEVGKEYILTTQYDDVNKYYTIIGAHSKK